MPRKTETPVEAEPAVTEVWVFGEGRKTVRVDSLECDPVRTPEDQATFYSLQDLKGGEGLIAKDFIPVVAESGNSYLVLYFTAVETLPA